MRCVCIKRALFCIHKAREKTLIVGVVLRGKFGLKIFNVIVLEGSSYKLIKYCTIFISKLLLENLIGISLTGSFVIFFFK